KLYRKMFRLPFESTKLPSCYEFEVDAVLGADMFMLTELYRDLGGFDPDYFLYGEEVDFQKRIADRGHKRLLIRGPKIMHLEGRSSDNSGRKLSFNTIYRLEEGSLIYIRKHYSRIYYVIFVFVQFLTWYPWVLMDKRFNSSQRNELRDLLLR